MPIPLSDPESDSWERRRALATEQIARILGYAFGLAVAFGVCWGMGDIVLLVFAAALIACLLRGGADGLAKRIGGPAGLWLALIVLAVFGFFGFEIFVRGPVIAVQLHEIWGQLRQQATDLWTRYGQADWMQPVLGRVRAWFESGTQKIAGVAAGFATSTLGSLGTLLVMLVTAIFFAIDPRLYIAGTLHLLPKAWRPHGREVMHDVGHVLRWWFIGQVIDMAAIGLLTGIGLSVLGVRLAFTLALIAGLFNFVPYVGALAGAVPAVLIALGQGPQTAIYTAILFLVVQTLEGNLIAPLIQKRTVELAPVLTILSQTVLGTLFGPLGLILATPLTAAGVEFVKKVYVEEILDDASQQG